MSGKLEIGVISNGTLRAPDLAEAILQNWEDFLDEKTSNALFAIVVDGESDESCETVSEALDELQESAPWLCHVGFHEDDGARLGCFPDFHAIESEERDGNLLKVSDPSELDSIDERDADYALVVSDHGNATLYSLTPDGPVEQWAIV